MADTLAERLIDPWSADYLGTLPASTYSTGDILARAGEWDTVLPAPPGAPRDSVFARMADWSHHRLRQNDDKIGRWVAESRFPTAAAAVAAVPTFLGQAVAGFPGSVGRWGRAMDTAVAGTAEGKLAPLPEPTGDALAPHGLEGIDTLTVIGTGPVAGAAGRALAGLARFGDPALVKPGQSVHSFGGEIAARNLAKAGEARPQQAIALAQEMRARGESPQRIYDATNELLEGTPYAGVHFGVDGKPRFEISDERMSANIPEPRTGVLGMVDFMTGRGRKFKQKGLEGPYVSHPELAAAYPSETAKIKTTIRRGSKYDDLDAFADRNNVDVTVGYGVPGRLRDVVAHEYQHAVPQRIEGFTGGGGPIHMPGHAFYFPASSGFGREIKRHSMYERLAGEVEARNVENRVRMTADERRATPPWQTQDTAYAQQLERPTFPEFAWNTTFGRWADSKAGATRAEAFEESGRELSTRVGEDPGKNTRLFSDAARPAIVKGMMVGTGDDLVTLYHGTSAEAAGDIRASGAVGGPAFFSPRKDAAASYGDVVVEVNVPKSALKIDFDLPSGRLLSVDEANAYAKAAGKDTEGWTIDDWLRSGQSVGVEGGVDLAPSTGPTLSDRLIAPPPLRDDNNRDL